MFIMILEYIYSVELKIKLIISAKKNGFIQEEQKCIIQDIPVMAKTTGKKLQKTFIAESES